MEDYRPKPNREVYDRQGNPENPEVLKQREQIFKEVRVENREKDPKLVEILEKINFDLLKELFLDRAKRSGIDPQSFNFIGPNRVSGNSNIFYYALYDMDGNTINLSFEQIKNLCLENDAEDCLPLLVLELLTHELTHVVSKNKCRGFTTPKNLTSTNTDIGSYRKKQSGYNIPSINLKDRKFEDFDEGVTQKFAWEIFEEYLENSRFATEEEKIKFYNFFHKIQEELGYPAQVEMINLIIKKISKNSKQSEKVVWEALIRGKFEGDQNLLSGENILVDAIGSIAANELSELEGEEDTIGFIERNKK